MNLITLIQEKNEAFVDLCRAHKVDKLYAFGSAITDHLVNCDTIFKTIKGRDK